MYYYRETSNQKNLEMLDVQKKTTRQMSVINEWKQKKTSK